MADGRIYFVADDGMTFVVKASDEFELLAKNALGERVFASPGVLRRRDLHPRGEAPVVHRGEAVRLIRVMLLRRIVWSHDINRASRVRS